MLFYFAVMLDYDILISQSDLCNIVEFHQETWIIYKSVKTGMEVRFLYIYYLRERNPDIATV